MFIISYGGINMKQKRTRKLTLGIIIQDEDPSKIGRIIRITKKQMNELDKNSKKINVFLDPKCEEIMDYYNKYEKREDNITY